MKRRRGSLAALTLAVACAASACGGGMSAADGLKKAKDVRASTAAMYWKVRDPLPTSLDEPDGQGAFSKCSKTSGALTYSIADYLQPMSGKPTMKQLFASIRTALAPQGWKFTSEGQLFNSNYTDPEKLFGYTARQNGWTVHLTLHEGKGSDPAAGYLNVSSSCHKYGKAQSDLLAKYHGKQDLYDPTAATPHPVPTGFPTQGS